MLPCCILVCRPLSLTPRESLRYNVQVLEGYEETHAQENLSTKENPSQARAWLFSADEHSKRKGHSQGPSPQREKKADRSLGPAGDSSGAMYKYGRLTRNAEFGAVHQQGRVWVNPLLVLKALPNNLPYSRYGFLVSKRVGKAVTRNKVKRWLREASRLTQISSGWDLVVIARPAAGTADYHRLEKALKNLLGRARLLSPTTGLHGSVGMEQQRQ